MPFRAGFGGVVLPERTPCACFSSPSAATATLGVSACTRTGDPNPRLSVNPGVAPRYNDRHYAWCARQYTSYNRSSNTYKRGRTLTRRRCVSPYI